MRKSRLFPFSFLGVKEILFSQKILAVIPVQKVFFQKIPAIVVFFQFIKFIFIPVILIIFCAGLLFSKKVFALSQYPIVKSDTQYKRVNVTTTKNVVGTQKTKKNGRSGKLSVLKMHLKRDKKNKVLSTYSEKQKIAIRGCAKNVSKFFPLAKKCTIDFVSTVKSLPEHVKTYSYVKPVSEAKKIVHLDQSESRVRAIKTAWKQDISENFSSREAFFQSFSRKLSPIALRSEVALVLDQETGKPLLEKNSREILPIASISKLLTAVVVLDSGISLSEDIEISAEDVDTERMSHSRLPVGARLTRGQMLQLALMSSENRAAHALGRCYPGGMRAFVKAMNETALKLNMKDSYFVEPTGLSSQNVSTARDLAALVRHAFNYPMIRSFSTTQFLRIRVGSRSILYHNTNKLVSRRDWEIGLQKTGYINEAGNCVVMQARIDGRAVVLVFLHADAPSARVADAWRVRSWIEKQANLSASLVEQVS